MASSRKKMYVQKSRRLAVKERSGEGEYGRGEVLELDNLDLVVGTTG